MFNTYKKTGSTNEQELFTNRSIWVHLDFNGVLCDKSFDSYVVFFWTIVCLSNFHIAFCHAILFVKVLYISLTYTGSYT